MKKNAHYYAIGMPAECLCTLTWGFGKKMESESFGGAIPSKGMEEAV